MQGLPGPALLQLPSLLDPAARLSLFQTCSSMRDLVLSQCHVCLHQHVPLTDEAEAQQAQNALNRVCWLSPSATLHLHANKGEAAAFEVNCSSGNLMFSAMAATLFNEGLTAIKSVELEGLPLYGIMPFWLPGACPKMESLRLRDCQFLTLPNPDNSVTTCGHLQELQLIHPPDISQQPQTELDSWTHQLQALIGLQRFSLGLDCLDEPFTWLACISAIGPQLTQLNFMPGALLVPARLPEQMATWFPNLRELLLPSRYIYDDDMEVLLGMRQLTRLVCRTFDLRRSYRHRPCPAWTQLGVVVLHVKPFSLLPLANAPEVQAIRSPNPDQPFGVVLHCKAYPKATIRAVEAIAMCGGIQWDAKIDKVLFCMDKLEGSYGRVDYMLPFLSGCQASQFMVSRAEPVTTGLLITLQRYLNKLQLHTVRFSQCKWLEDDALALVLRCMPSYPCKLSLDASDWQLSEAQFTEICAHACRPVQVEVTRIGNQWLKGWRERVVCAMHAIGNQHVTILE